MAESLSCFFVLYVYGFIHSNDLIVFDCIRFKYLWNYEVMIEIDENSKKYFD
jgi:hypothetical protein